MLYRQHAGNAVGAVDARAVGYLVGRALGADENRARMRAASTQASTFLSQFGDRLSSGDRAAVAACARLSDRGKLARVASLVHHGLWKNTSVRRIGQVLYV